MTKRRAPESLVKTKIKAVLKERQKDYADVGKEFVWTALSQRYQSGWPDFMIIADGQVTFIEAKAEGKKLRRLQEWVAKRLISAGAKYYLGTIRSERLYLEVPGEAGGESPREWISLAGFRRALDSLSNKPPT